MRSPATPWIRAAVRIATAMPVLPTPSFDFMGVPRLGFAEEAWPPPLLLAVPGSRFASGVFLGGHGRDLVPTSLLNWGSLGLIRFGGRVSYAA